MKRAVLSFVLTSLMIVSCSHEEDQRQAQIISRGTSDLEILTERTAKNPKDADAWYHIADLYDRTNNYQQEIEALRKVVAIQPKHGYAYFKMGTAHSRLAQYREAIKAFEKAKQFMPRNPVLFNNMALAYGKLNRPDDEIASLRTAIKLRPRYATARFNLGMVHLRTGNRQEALKDQKELQEIDITLAKELMKEIDKKR